MRYGTVIINISYAVLLDQQLARRSCLLNERTHRRGLATEHFIQLIPARELQLFQLHWTGGLYQKGLKAPLTTCLISETVRA
jgi:hypothetical protein